MSADNFQGIVDRVNNVLQKLGEKVDEFFDKLNHVLEFLPSFLEGPIKTGVNLLNAGIQTFNELMQKILAKMGSPDVLREVGKKWTTQVGHPAANVAGRMTSNYMSVDDYWGGKAKDAYKDTLSAQNDAFTAISGLAGKIDDALGAAANGITVFWIAVIAAILDLTAGCIAATAELCTGVGAPAAPPTLAAFFGAACTFIGAGLTALVVMLNNVADQTRALRQAKELATTFPDDKWPRATTGNNKWKPA